MSTPENDPDFLRDVVMGVLDAELGALPERRNVNTSRLADLLLYAIRKAYPERTRWSIELVDGTVVDVAERLDAEVSTNGHEGVTIYQNGGRVIIPWHRVAMLTVVPARAGEETAG